VTALLHMTFGDEVDKEGTIKTKPWKQIWRRIRKPGMQMKEHWPHSSEKKPRQRLRRAVRWLEEAGTCGKRDMWVLGFQLPVFGKSTIVSVYLSTLPVLLS